MGNVKRRRFKTEEREYQVGYRNPPPYGTWKPGQSGNPMGRRKGTRNFKTDVKATLTAPVQVTRGGKPRTISTQEAMLLRLREKALGGDIRAIHQLMQLAQIYNTDELAASVGLSAVDENVLQIYRRRILTGAIPATELIEDKTTSTNANGSSASAETSEIMPAKGSQFESDQPAGAKIAASNKDKKK